ncbi:MAG TPA: VWA domain-containing protein, partial [Euzebya sp.]|nr:VWA domain-containing protein [Euzebya sp.]
RLHRVTRRIVWVNPVAADPGFAPIAGGMAAALPFIDDLREGHSVASLESLVEALSQSVVRESLKRP